MTADKRYTEEELQEMLERQAPVRVYLSEYDKVLQTRFRERYRREFRSDSAWYGFLARLDMRHTLAKMGMTVEEFAASVGMALPGGLVREENDEEPDEGEPAE